MPPNDEGITLYDIDTSTDDVPATASDVGVTTQAVMDRLAVVGEEKEALIAENERLRVKARTTEILDDLIKPYAQRTFWFMVGYCVFVGLYLLMYSWGCFTVKVETSVLEFLVGSTAVTVIGLVGMVLTGIFVGARPK